MELELQSIYEGIDKGNTKLGSEIAGLVNVRDKMSAASKEISGITTLAEKAQERSERVPPPEVMNAGPNGEPRY